MATRKIAANAVPSVTTDNVVAANAVMNDESKLAATLQAAFDGLIENEERATQEAAPHCETLFRTIGIHWPRVNGKLDVSSEAGQKLRAAFDDGLKAAQTRSARYTKTYVKSADSFGIMRWSDKALQLANGAKPEALEKLDAYTVTAAMVLTKGAKYDELLKAEVIEPTRDRMAGARRTAFSRFLAYCNNGRKGARADGDVAKAFTTKYKSIINLANARAKEQIITASDALKVKDLMNEVKALLAI